MGEFAASEAGLAFIDRDRVMLEGLHRACHEVTREAIVTWLGELMPDVVDDAEPDPQATILFTCTGANPLPVRLRTPRRSNSAATPRRDRPCARSCRAAPQRALPLP